MSVRHRVIAGALVVVLVLCASATCFAQTFYMQPIPEQKARFGARFLSPKSDSRRNMDMDFLGGSYDVYANVPIARNLNLTAQLAVTHAKYTQWVAYYAPGVAGYLMYDSDGYWRQVDETAFGNLYLGCQVTVKSTRDFLSVFSGGVYMPTAEKDKWRTRGVGQVSDYYELYRVLPDLWTFYANLAGHLVQPRQVGPLLGAELGLEMYKFTDDYYDDALHGHYALTAGFRIEHMALKAELMGLYYISETDGYFGPFDHWLAFGVAVIDYPIRPHLSYQIPLDDEYDRFLDGVLGIKLEFAPF